jgi:hypothetical protein
MDIGTSTASLGKNNVYSFFADYDKNFLCAQLNEGNCSLVKEIPELLTTFETVDINIQTNLVKYEGTAFSFEYDPSIWTLEKKEDLPLNEYTFKDHVVLKHKFINASIRISPVTGYGFAQVRTYTTSAFYVIDGKQYTPNTTWISPCDMNISNDCIKVNNVKDLSGRNITTISSIGEPNSPIIIKDENGSERPIYINIESSFAASEDINDVLGKMSDLEKQVSNVVGRIDIK